MRDNSRKIRTVIYGKNSIDIDELRGYNAETQMRNLSDFLAELTSQCMRLAVKFGLDFNEGKFLSDLIANDFDSVRARKIDEIYGFMGGNKNNSLKYIEKWVDTGVIYKVRTKGKKGADRWAVNYVAFAELTGIEIIAY